MAYLSVEGLSYRVGTFEGGPFSFSLEKGEILSILGPSGSGKTLLLKTIAGLVPQTGGRILLEGEDISGRRPSERGLSMMFQGYALFPHMNTEHNIGFPLLIRKVREAIVKTVVKRKAKEIDGSLERYLEFMPRELSEGHKQLTALARCTVREVKLVLIDEPFTQLDRRVHEGSRTTLKRFLKEKRITAIVALNDVEDALALSDKLLVINEGKQVAFGRPLELYNNPPNPFVADFLSPYGICSLDGRDAKILGIDAPEDATVFVRPEDVEVALQGIEGEVEDCTFIDPSRAIVTVKVGKVQVQALVRCEIEFEPGKRVRIKINRFFAFRTVDKENGLW